MNTGKYDALIKKIKTKRIAINILFIFIALIALFLCSPNELVVLDEVILSYDGVNPVATVFIVLFILFCYIIAMAFALSPMTASMITECEPEKHLALNSALNKAKNLDDILTMDYFYLGDFKTALSYSYLQCQKKKSATVCTGLFNKARCQFFIKDFELLKATTEQFKNEITTAKANKKLNGIYKKMLNVLNLMVAIAENNKKKITELKEIESWNNCKPTQGFINYLKGLAAYTTDDNQEAIYRFKSAKETLEKTVFFQLSEEYLLKLKNQNN